MALLDEAYTKYITDASLSYAGKHGGFQPGTSLVAKKHSRKYTAWLWRDYWLCWRNTRNDQATGPISTLGKCGRQSGFLAGALASPTIIAFVSDSKKWNAGKYVEHTARAAGETEYPTVRRPPTFEHSSVNDYPAGLSCPPAANPYPGRPDGGRRYAVGPSRSAFGEEMNRLHGQGAANKSCVRLNALVLTSVPFELTVESFWNNVNLQSCATNNPLTLFYCRHWR